MPRSGGACPPTSIEGQCLVHPLNHKTSPYQGLGVRVMMDLANANKKMAATLNTKLRSGQVSREKVDNLVKAKAEHVGILREVEVLQSDPASLSVIQRGRLANLQGTAQAALDLLKEANP